MFKASLTTIIVALVLQSGAMAQIYVKNPGNVGIGFSAPAIKLHVNGDNVFQQRITSTGAFAGLYMKSSAATKQLGLHYGSDGTAGLGTNSLRFGRYDPNGDQFGNGWQANPVVFDLDAPDGSLTVDESGTVGIGTTTPYSGYKLDVIGTAKATMLEVNSGTEDGGRLVLRSQGHPDWRIRNFNGLGFFPGEGAPTALWLDNSGTVGIGVMYTEGYKVKVDGSIRAASFVGNSGKPWADYVFDSAYKLPSLPEVKSYISQNHHLFEVPSEEEVNKNGVNVIDNQVILLKKIEELTLYTIEQHEKQQQFEKDLKELKVENAALKATIKELLKKN
jgi:hypothetical protein